MRVLSKLLTTIWILAFLALIAGFVAYTPLARQYADDHLYVVDNKQTIAVTTSAGEALSLGVRIPSAVSGLWASPDGMTLTFAGQQPIILMQPKPQTWGDEITTNLKDITDDQTATGRYFVPEVSGPTVLDGKITGTVVRPVGGLVQFHNEQTIIDVPVKITVDPAGTTRTSGDRLTLLVYGMLAAAGVMALCALAMIVTGLRKNGLKNAGGGLVSGVFFTAVFAGVAYVAEKFAVPDVSDVDVLGALPMSPIQFIGCVGAAVFLTLFGLALGADDDGRPDSLEPAPAIQEDAR
ncbi:hypothetical protein [Actinoplanes sichuanensis]|uniref:DUF4436 domain-containing protein n=1 Tax=Actinoplanes sichuanensis TaxID=512349 RepID=A0ABW4AIW2_9ACTN|nr:hypothetical protein [Actinoplanes sichuanensis]